MLFTATELASITNGRMANSHDSCVVRTLSWDSRSIAQDALYVALAGNRVDGHNYCIAAVEAGASAVLATRELDAASMAAIDKSGAAYIVVSDAIEALSSLAGAWRTRLQGSVIALTGSSGKTTTKNLIAAVLAEGGSVVATRANQNNEIGVPATILAADENTNFVVVEMGMRGLGQLASLCSFVRPDWALVTNVGTSHMELLGSQDAIARAKAEPFCFLEPGSGTAFINASDAFRAQLVEYGRLAQRGVETRYFDGSGNETFAKDEQERPYAYATNITFDNAGRPSFTINIPTGSAPCSLQLAGAHNVHNAMAAAAVGAKAGLSAQAIAHGLESCLPEKGRQRVVEAACGATVIDDSYNANPDSMCASLASFYAMHVSGRRIAVLGDMGELGDFSQEGHALVGTRAAGCNLARLVCVGSLAEGIARAAIEGGMDPASVECVANAQEALSALTGNVGAGDFVLVKASHSVGLDKVVEGLVG